jgi:preprotein translocase subunit SecA
MQVQRVVEETQSRVERYYYELRQRLFEFDEVLAVQREQTYARRGGVLRGSADAVMRTISDLSQQTARDIVKANLQASQPAATLAKLKQFFPDVQLEQVTLQGDDAEQLTLAAVAAAVNAKAAALDAVKPGLAAEAARFLILTQEDTLWKAHMKDMSFVKEWAGLKIYAGSDPINVYREEGLRLYQGLLTQLRQNLAFSFSQYQPRM